MKKLCKCEREFNGPKNRKYCDVCIKNYHKEYHKTPEYREKKKLYNKKYRRTNKGKESNRRSRRYRRAFLNNIIEDFSNIEWLNKLMETKGVCPKCHKYIGIWKLTLDHIYPVSLANKDYLKTGIKRIYTINDIQPLCNICNIGKCNKLEVYN